ncbi:MAG: hypothetical protein MUO99_03010, partial [Dehalococcoidales bacterium]|nr:hypothetical protein [Dehalococcoidales bacterium]
LLVNLELSVKPNRKVSNTSFPRILPGVTIPAGTKIVNASLCGVWDILYTLQAMGTVSNFNQSWAEPNSAIFRVFKSPDQSGLFFNFLPPLLDRRGGLRR